MSKRQGPNCRQYVYRGRMSEPFSREPVHRMQFAVHSGSVDKIDPDWIIGVDDKTSVAVERRAQEPAAWNGYTYGEVHMLWIETKP